MDTRQDSERTNLIPFQQVVCDFGTVVAWRLWTTDGWTQTRETQISWGLKNLTRRKNKIPITTILIRGCGADEIQVTSVLRVDIEDKHQELLIHAVDL